MPSVNVLRRFIEFLVADIFFSTVSKVNLFNYTTNTLTDLTDTIIEL